MISGTGRYGACVLAVLVALAMIAPALAEHSVDTTEVPILGVALEVGRDELVNGDTLPLARNVPASLNSRSVVPGSGFLVSGCTEVMSGT
jgi:hypothetical protein